MKTGQITTDRQVASLRTTGQRYEAIVANTRGLAIRVYPTGARVFQFRYVALNGARRRLPLGAYPGLSLADAKEKAQALRVHVVDGLDPAAERANARASARTGDTLAELADAYFQAAAKGLHGGRGRPKRASTLAVERTRFKIHIEASLGGRRFKEIGRADIKAFMRELATSGALAADTIASIGATLSAILAFAVHEERLEANPATGLTRPLALRSRDRMPADGALAALWRSLVAVSTTPLPNGPLPHPNPPAASTPPRRACVEPVMALAIRFAMLTLARRTDVTSALWSEFDLSARTWIVPAERFKAGRAHVIPLSDAALSVLVDAAGLAGDESAFVFPSPSSAKQPITGHALTRAVTRTLASLSLPHGSPHDFRRAGATALTGESLGFRRFVVGKVLGHAVQDGAAVTGVYDRNEYLADKRAALAAWAGHLLSLADAEPLATNVVSLRGRRG